MVIKINFITFDISGLRSHIDELKLVQQARRTDEKHFIVHIFS